MSIIAEVKDGVVGLRLHSPGMPKGVVEPLFMLVGRSPAETAAAINAAHENAPDVAGECTIEVTSAVACIKVSAPTEAVALSLFERLRDIQQSK